MGDFAQQSLPLNDSVTLLLLLSNASVPVQVTVSTVRLVFDSSLIFLEVTLSVKVQYYLH